MSSQRYVSTSFWDDPWVCNLDPSEKLLYLYFMTGPLTNIAGVYELTNRRISFDTGFNVEMIEKMVKRFSKDGKAYHYENYIILPSWPKHQKWEQRSKIKQGIDNVLSKLPKNILTYMVSIGYQYDLNYLDLDIELEFKLDFDIEREISTLPVRDFNKDWDNLREYWKASGFGEYRKPLIHESDYGPLANILNLYTYEEMEKAIDNYKEADPECKYGSFRSFITKGVEQYFPGAYIKQKNKDNGYDGMTKEEWLKKVTEGINDEQ